MRRESVAARTAAEARRLAPWAAVVVRVEGGYLAFESVADYAIWRRQR